VNTEFSPVAEKKVKIAHVIPINLIPYEQRTAFMNMAYERNNVYPDAAEKIEVVNERQNLKTRIQGLIEAGYAVGVALDDKDDIDKLPNNVKMLVFERLGGRIGNFRQMEGVIAMLRALHIGDVRARNERLSRIYEMLTGESAVNVPPTEDPREFARRFIVRLPPIKVEDKEELKKMNERMLALLSAA
jgi:hypothetical protein